ncbi:MULTISPECIES: FtsX-like permease family protein [unclassified Microbacterium]|uniref:FtsX-like permease family protein n=1 Tax=unclassified Microbacterium TaxID=2609290 RepID=UPI0038659F1E
MTAIAPLRRRDEVAPMLRILWLVARPGAQSTAVLLLPVIAFAVTTALLLTVAGGTAMFFSWSERDVLYPALGAIACTLLVVPLISLSGVAARLSARRRDDRLATLRLLGATSAGVTLLAVAESTVLAAVGVAVGVVLHVALVPLVGLIPFGGAPVGAAALFLTPSAGLLVCAGVVAIAAISAAIGLRRVRITPLGVRARTDAPPLRYGRVLIGVVVIGAAVAALQVAPGDLLLSMVVICGALAAAIAVLNLVGPWVLGVIGRAQLKAARGAAALVAARGVLEDPKAAWRQVSGIAMTSFIAVVGGVGLARIDDIGDVDPIMADIRTGILVTLAVSFVMVACTVGVSQAAAILDRREVWVNLDRAGMPDKTMTAIRRRQVLMPLVATVVVSVTVGGLLVAPLVGAALLFEPLSLVVIASCFALGFACVLGALRATDPVLRRALAEPVSAGA